MTEFARGTRHLQNATLPLHSPYGDNWDLLTIGHNGVNNKPHREQKYWVTQNDPTVIAPSRRNWSRMPDLSAPALGGDHTRVVHEVGKMTATQAYAISLRGAARLLYDQSMAPHAQAIDMAMLQLCRRDVWGPTPFCLGAYPMLFGRFRAAGPMDKDSDRRVLTEEVTPGAGRVRNATRMNHESEFTVFPISLNIEKLLKNDPIIPAQVPDSDLLKEVDLREFVLPRGRPVFVRPDEYVDRQKEAAAAGKPLKAPEPVPVDPAVVE
ncbi:hypothetical protein GQ43DRAFT_439153 [Delitschia confertaspora ATCC 74209]|uniref:Uncharacterized protein n=1 Tax=Delitschia confertaspora ATCC 74209 TaxID=1513339 RepID=A0A9P4N0Q9_9PLEO|nr:hypothetical protein GQ43DRAFT_439153 [Delitschia confertaspora ATCC 74209]